jgi:uncharacterized protein (TIGR02145 family)
MKKLFVPLVCLIFGVGLISSCKKDPVIPTLTTASISNITINSVTAGGDITDNGGEEVSSRGVSYSTTRNPTVEGLHTSTGTGTGSFTSNITGLTPNTLYYVKAYATNVVGTAYGDEISFTTTPIVIPTLTTTAVTFITLTTAVSGGNITADGGGAITERGVCWATSVNPTISNSKTTDGTGTGNFVSNLAGLLPGTTYYVRSYATNSAGTAYGDDTSFTTSPVVLPTITTTALSSVTLTTAVSGGNITADGGGAISEKGICWATTPTPTVSNSKTSDGTGTGSYVSNLSELLPGTTYHVRAYAVNSAGTAYGDELSFTTIPVGAATVTTTAVTSITLTTAASGGNITADGGGSIIAKGVCWSLTTNPTISNLKTGDGTGTGIFISNVTGLLPGTTYYLRAYATNSAGTAYGNEVSFTTDPIVIPSLTTATVTLITQTSAISGGSITSDGGGAITVKGVCWSTTANPTTSNNKTTNGAGSGSFISNLTLLQPGTTYYLRSYATNSAGTAYGNPLSFTTSPVVVATLSTSVITSITATTAVSGGNITADGGGSITGRGVCWAVTANPTTSNSKTTDGTGTGTFISNLTTLLPGTTYHVKAYAINAAGTSYGNELIFTTAPGLPTLTTAAAGSITLTTAVSGGNITADGGGAVTARGVCWATTSNPTTGNSKTTDGAGAGSFTSNLTGLLPGTAYFIRSYATNSAGTAYGNQVTFTTNAIVLPSLTTTAITSIALATAVSGGNITSDGGGAITARGACWSTTADPTLTNSFSVNGTGIGSFTSNITGLAQGTTYYVRAYATNGAGTAYGNQFTFNTKMADIEMNTYNTTTIGTQVWMAENLKTTRLNDNTIIPNVTDNTAWTLLSTPALCYFDNDQTTYRPLYGALYNWFTVLTGNLCPTGWHVPTDAEYNTMELYLGVPLADINLYDWRGTDQGSEMKNTTGWPAGQNGTNTSGFSGTPGGYRYAADGSFQALDQWTYWWTGTEHDATRAWYRRLDGDHSDVYKASTEKRGGKYIRCIKN